MPAANQGFNSRGANALELKREPDSRIDRIFVPVIPADDSICCDPGREGLRKPLASGVIDRDS
jgi:hypothetical protein